MGGKLNLIKLVSFAFVQFLQTTRSVIFQSFAGATELGRTTGGFYFGDNISVSPADINGNETVLDTKFQTRPNTLPSTLEFHQNGPAVNRPSKTSTKTIKLCHLTKTEYHNVKREPESAQLGWTTFSPFSLVGSL